MEHFDRWKDICEIVRSLKLQARMQLRDGKSSNWGKWIIEPTDNYIELEGFGPISKKSVKWIELRFQTKDLEQNIADQGLEASKVKFALGMFDPV